MKEHPRVPGSQVFENEKEMLQALVEGHILIDIFDENENCVWIDGSGSLKETKMLTDHHKCFGYGAFYDHMCFSIKE